MTVPEDIYILKIQTAVPSGHRPGSRCRLRLDEYSCRHGMGYTTISAKKEGVSSSVTYFIPEGKQYEVWKATVKNETDQVKNIKLFSYVEFSCYIASFDIECDWPRYFFDCPEKRKSHSIQSV